jgi:hypothetical protein
MNLITAEWYANERAKDFVREADAARLAALAKSLGPARPGWGARVPRSIGRIRVILHLGRLGTA